MAGLLGYGGAQNGILGGYQQQTPDWAQKLGLFSAAIKDAANSFSGQGDTNSLQTWQQGQQGNQIRQQQEQARQAILQAGSDPAALKQALTNYALMGGNPAPLMSAMTFDQPKIESYGEGQNVFSVDPLTGVRTQIQTGHEKPPAGYKDGPDGSYSAIPGGPADPKNPLNFKAPPGYRYDATGTKLGLVPGYLGAAGELAAARRKPDAPAASIGAQNPAAMFRRGR